MSLWRQLFGKKAGPRVRAQTGAIARPPTAGSPHPHQPSGPVVRKPTPTLYDAAEAGNIDAVRALLQNGADPNAKNQFGCAPVAVAAWGAKYEIVNLLAEHGANLEDATKGETALDCAVCADFMRTNLERGFGRTTKPQLAPDDVLRTVETLLEHGAKPITAKKDPSIVTWAVIWCDERVVRRLLAAGAELKLEEALTWARREKKESMVRLLLEHAPGGGQPPQLTTSRQQHSHETPTAQEQALQRTLKEIEAKLRARRDPSLPVVSLGLETTPLGRKIVWCFATEYGGRLDVDAAVTLLNKELEAQGVTVSDSGYMGSPAGQPVRRSNLFNYAMR